MKPKFKVGEIVVQLKEIIKKDNPLAKIVVINQDNYKDNKYHIEHTHPDKKERMWAGEHCFRKATKQEIKEYMIDKL